MPINTRRTHKNTYGIKWTAEIKQDLEGLTLEEYNSIPRQGRIRNLSPKSSQSGFSDYYYTRFFMPKWSTAYKYQHSNHARVVEPVITDLTYTVNHIDACIKGTLKTNKFDPLSDRPLYLPRYLEQGDKGLQSKKNLSNLREEYYTLGTETLLDFGRHTTIYVQTISYLPELELVISGMYKTNFISCTVKLSSKGYIKLPQRFSKIFRIDKTSHNLEFLEGNITIRVTNALPLTDFVKEARNTKDLEYSETTGRLTLYNEDTSVVNTFSFNGARYPTIFVDKDDNIICTDKGNVYSGKLDANLSLPLPKDVSSNNSPFIDICNMDTINYRIDLYIKKFVTTTDTQMFCVSVEDSKGEMLYLDKSLNLSSERVFLKLSEVFRDMVTINLEMEEGLEYVIIRLEDWDNIYTNVGIITQPIIKLNKMMELPTDSQDMLYLIDDVITFKHMDEVNYLSALE